MKVKSRARKSREMRQFPRKFNFFFAKDAQGQPNYFNCDTYDRLSKHFKKSQRRTTHTRIQSVLSDKGRRRNVGKDLGEWMQKTNRS